MAGFKILVIGALLQILVTEQIQYPKNKVDLEENTNEHKSETNLSIAVTTTVKNLVNIEDNAAAKTYTENSRIYFQIQDNSIGTSLVSCVSKIVDQYFTNGELLTVFSYTEHVNILSILQQLFRTCKINIYTQNSIILSQESTRKSSNYIIMIKSLEELEKSVEILQNTYWNPYGRILITTPMVYPNLWEVSAQMARILWTYKAMNAVYLLPNNLNSSIIDIYTWFPYANSSCADNFTQTRLIDQCIAGKLQHGTDIFMTKVPKDLNQCLVQVQAVLWPPYVIPPTDYNGSLSMVNLQDGFEITLMKTIADELNLTMNYGIVRGENDCGYISAEGESFGLMHLLVTAQVDLAVGALATVDMRHRLLEPSVQYGSDTIVFCVPTAKEYPKWTTIYHIYNLQTWIVILFMYILVSIVVRTIGWLKNEESNCFTSWNKCFFNIFAVTLSMSIAHLPRGGIARFVFFIWCIFSLHFTALYQSLLMRYLVKPLYQRQVKTVQEMLDFGTVSGSYFELNDITQPEHTTLVEKRLLQQWTRCDQSMSQCLEHVAFQRNYSMAVPRLYMAYTSNEYETSNGKSLMYCFQETLLYYPIVLYGYRGLPFMERINRILTAMTSSGIMNKWKDDLKSLMRKRHIVEGEDAVRVITLEHLQGAFLVYTFGITLSLGAFIVERIVIKVGKKYFRKSSI